MKYRVLIEQEEDGFVVAEVCDWRRLAVHDARRELATAPECFATWFPLALDRPTGRVRAAA